MSYQSEVLADSPLLYLQLNETSGTTCANSGSLGGNATITGSVTRNVATAHSALGVCVEMPGSAASYISYPDNAALDITGDVTYECWASLDGFAGNQGLMGKGNDGGAGYFLKVVVNRSIRIEQSGLVSILNIATAWPASTAWHHVAFTRVGNTYTIYLDGASIGSGSDSTGINATNRAFFIGVENTSGGPTSVQSPLDGKIDEVAVYNTGLSAARILAHYNAALTPPAPVANFTGTPLTGEAPLNVTFTDTSTNTPSSWAWTFGDGGTSTSQNPSHNYTTPGTYNVQLTATNAGGSDAETKTAYVVVDVATDPIVYAEAGGISIA